MYKATFHKDWPDYFDKLENTVKEHVSKKIQKILEHPKKRHLGGGAKYFVDEIGQHRILYMVFEEKQEVRFFFVGNHKEYEKWYKNLF
ncbi:type II toxin-antitoxin system RelE/ParE family toxin [Candidatus Micrarchaeota archaeon]|nr:type II toxin-antitoxin system RelE/ParE family toxin [Candidatus Micrarchaeota archaeon]MBU2476475.1 type II toxin-antitoxin system RelE/ParE family toxin [Candidatus Micrarchaeota archaeon]